MNIKQLAKLLSKHKLIVISITGTAAIACAVIISTSLPHSSQATADSTYATFSAASSSASTTYAKKTNETSRGTQPPLDPSKGDVIKLGTKNSIVQVIQQKLMALDYIEADEPTEEFGESLQYAVQLFQRKNELPITGEVDAKTYQLLMSETAKKYTVYIGAEGTDVEQLQQRLYELGYIQKVTSYFGTETDAAVKEFQRRNGLYDDGNVGKLTREALYSEHAIPMSYYLGDKNDEILKYKEKLYSLGYLTTKPTNVYDNDTVIAVKHFQENNGLIADGYVGPATKELLMSDQAEENAMTIGDSGDDVTNVQSYLKKLGYLDRVTGYFGSDTYEAVTNFQKRNGLNIDGKVGSQTISKLLSGSAKRWNGNTSGGSSGSSNSGGSGASGSDSGGNIASPSVDRLISVAKSKLGARYVYGAKGPNTFDCSGFVYWVLNHSGIKQGYMTSDGWQGTGRFQRISSMSSIQRGDIISYNGHVGIALGNNQMIDASSSAGRVRITNITSSYWTRNFICAYRIF